MAERYTIRLYIQFEKALNHQRATDNIVASYQQYNDIKTISKANAKLDITTSTPKKRRLPVSTESDISPLGKPVKVLDNIFSQLDNTSYFGGLLNTSSTNDSNILHSILTLNKKYHLLLRRPTFLH